MGIAVLSGVIDSLESASAKSSIKLNGHTNGHTNGHSHSASTAASAEKWESHTPGTMTPTEPLDATVPSSFIACVSREETAKKLEGIFGGLGELGKLVEVVASQNVQSVREADVVLLWCVCTSFR
jgi:pyrroline-5-carboxylate reductase